MSFKVLYGRIYFLRSTVGYRRGNYSTEAGDIQREKKEDSEEEKTVEVKILRYNPNHDSKPYFQTFHVTDFESGGLVLDTLIHIKNDVDPTLCFRRSCREGVCGSCAMNINGLNKLACILPKTCKMVITPLVHAYIIRDLVVDLSLFYEQYKSIEPWLQRRVDEPAGDRQLLQSQADRDKLDEVLNCVLCACCSFGCPTYWWGGQEDRFLGPAAILQAHRWILDSRDEKHCERLAKMKDYYKVFRCHNIFNCTSTCPKHLNPAKSVSEMKRYLSGMKAKEDPDLLNPPLAAKQQTAPTK